MAAMAPCGDDAGHDDGPDASATLELFVPGRLCLIGEHSDWAGGFRQQNPALTAGVCLVVGTNQGLHARARATAARTLALSCTVADAAPRTTEIPLEAGALLAVAQAGGFFSYAAGVAYRLVLEHKLQGGVAIDNYRTTLPVGKGLSSSAALCVLVARAFNRLHGLKLSTRGEMEVAYRGETTTPSQCGRLDQCCAFGPGATVRMTFDGEDLRCERVAVGAALHFVVVDLGASKDTKEILSALREGYPEPATPAQARVAAFLGPDNARLVGAARAALVAGDPAALGAAMSEYQALFDRMVAPACPAQLRAPVLHAAIADADLAPHVYGAKGVGSQGDGTAQFLCRSAADQAAVLALVETKWPAMRAMPLTIAASAAGAGADLL